MINDSKVMPPLGILHLGAVLEQAGHEPKIVDLAGEPEDAWEKRFRREALDADLVGITATTPQYPHALRARDIVRDETYGVPVVIGGVHATSMPDACMNAFDSVVYGEGERAILKICEDWSRKALKKLYREPLWPNLDTLPYPARHLLDIGSYHYVVGGRPATTLFTQRGCPYSCLTAGTLVTMQDGTKKPIEKIREGDLLWTYDRKTITKMPSRVVKIYSHTVPVHDLVKIWASSYDRVHSRGEAKRLWLTREHPVYTTTRGWVRADQLMVGDKGLSVWKGGIPSRPNPVARKRMLENNPMKDPVIRAKVAESMRRRFRSDPDLVARIASKSQLTRLHEQGGLSKGQRELFELVRSVTDEKVVSEHPVLSYLCDVAVPAHKIDFEYDGHRRHWLQPEHDLERDRKLASEGWRTIRVANREVWRTHHMLERISGVLGQVQTNRARPLTIQKVVLMQDKKREVTVYDLSAEPAHSFVANGLLVGNCSYCESPLMGSFKLRFRSPQNVAGEIRECMAKWGFTGFHFFDDEFNLIRDRTIGICKEIQPLDVRWRCFVVAGKSDKEVLTAMKDAGCVEVAVGYETGSDRLLKGIHKPATVAINMKFAEVAREVGIRVKAFMIVGLPGETWDTVRETENFLRVAKPDDVNFSILQVYPGSPIAQHPEQYDVKFGMDWGRMYHVDGVRRPIEHYEKLIQVRTSGMTEQDILKARDMLEQEFKPAYRPSAYDDRQDVDRVIGSMMQ